MKAEFDPHGSRPVRVGGVELSRARGVLVCLHGRGASAEDILGLGLEVAPEDWSVLAPQAAGSTWYPRSFLEPLQANEPWLSSALGLLSRIVAGVELEGLDRSRVALLGFSQGACLNLEWVLRNPARYRGVVALTGGYPGTERRDPGFAGDFGGTPVLLTSGDPDPHVPWSRVEDTATWLRRLGAEVELRRYPGRSHTVSEEEVERARAMLGKDSGEG